MVIPGLFIDPVYTAETLLCKKVKCNYLPCIISPRTTDLLDTHIRNMVFKLFISYNKVY